jgi:anti-sigma B factor antagonist
MEIIKTKNGMTLEVKVLGRLDTNTAPELDDNIKKDIDNVEKIELDLKELDYISSAGLRTVLVIHKAMSAKKGKLVIKNIKDEVMEVFDMTGFSSFLNIEE